MQKRMSGFEVRANKSKTERLKSPKLPTSFSTFMIMRELSRYAPPTCVVNRKKNQFAEIIPIAAQIKAMANSRQRH